MANEKFDAQNIFGQGEKNEAYAQYSLDKVI